MTELQQKLFNLIVEHFREDGEVLTNETLRLIERDVKSCNAAELRQTIKAFEETA